MATTNEHTGDKLVSKASTKAYADGWDRIFGKKKKETKEKEENINEDKVTGD